MKILITFLSFGIDVFAGMEHSINNFANGLVEIGHDVIIYTGDMNYSKKLLDQKYKVYVDKALYNKKNIQEIDNLILDSYEKNSKEITKNLKMIIDRESPDYILAEDHLWGILPYIDVRSFCRCRIGILFHMTHNPQLIIESLKYGFDDYYCVSEYVKEEIQYIMVKNHSSFQVNLKILPNCVGKEFFKNGICTKKHINKVLCNARISYEKGVDILLEAWQRLFEEERPDVKLYLTAGDFHFLPKASVFSKIAKINEKYNCIKLIPNISWEKMPALYSYMDLIVQPSREESFGLSVLEALASNRMIISSSAGNLKTLMLGICATYIPNDVESLMHLMSAAFKNQFSYDFELAKLRAARYLNTRIAKEWIDTL